jgi:hypothetical protein
MRSFPVNGVGKEKIMEEYRGRTEERQGERRITWS